MAGKVEAFTFDHVFDCPSEQETFYNYVRHLIDGCFEGYNAAVLTYGQTGHEKTYMTSTGCDLRVHSHEQGIIPQSVRHLFDGIAARQQKARDQGKPHPEFEINVQFMELCNEEIFDLLSPGKYSHEPGRKSVKVHEDSKEAIYSIGVTAKTVQNAQQVMKFFDSGTLSRKTASTQMNVLPSSSHTVFTLNMQQQRVVKLYLKHGLSKEQEEDYPLSKVNKESSSMNVLETLNAKFHFVDLAASEQLKCASAYQNQPKQNIFINCGLLDLANFISALGVASKGLHVPYSDSKFTKILQEYLGGNSRTLMITCIFPCDLDFLERLNSLIYVNQVKNIKNQIMVNEEKSNDTIAALRREIQELKRELKECKQGRPSVGKNATLQSENKLLRTRMKVLQETVDILTVKNTELLAEQATEEWFGGGDSDTGEGVKNLIQGYLKEFEELRTKLIESEEVGVQLRRQLQRYQARTCMGPNSTVTVTGMYNMSCSAEDTSVENIHAEAKHDVENLKRQTKHLSSKGNKEDERSDKISDVDEDTTLNSENESSDSEAEELEEDKTIDKDLATLTIEISLKQKMIGELEKCQRRLQSMRMWYESKLMQLQQKIRETEMENDRIISNMSSAGASKDTGKKEQKIKTDIECKLNDLQGQLKKMQSAEHEHAKLMKNQSEYELQVRKLKEEVAKMEKNKVALARKMKRESRRNREAEKQGNQQTAQMLKESRQQGNRTSSLGVQNHNKETVLKRFPEDMAALRKQAPSLSERIVGPVPQQNPAVSNGQFCPKVANHNWQNLEKNIEKLVLTKQSVYTLQKVKRSLLERERLTRYLERLMREEGSLLQAGKDIRDLDDEIDSVRANLDYLNDNIRECQALILQVEDTKDDTDCLELRAVLEGIVEPQGRYLLDKLLHMAINQSSGSTEQKSGPGAGSQTGTGRG
ncbi:kinesin-like protein KIF21A [Rhipicephalus microplus]|uniref:kinesin-like protein KIF21A n=1 Tax=Rhipicephalus microplus TaxID=6941 RepID=UPI003F6A61AC